MQKFWKRLGFISKRVFQAGMLVALVSLSVGFRDTGYRHNISQADPTIWVRPCVYNLDLQPGTFPAGDQLEFETVVTLQEMLNSIFGNINGVGFSFVRLALYPEDENNPGTPQAGDSTFTLEKASTRTIDICFEDSSYDDLVGENELDVSGNTITHCTTREGSESDPADELTEIWVEAILLCMGLDRPQETKWSILSYFWEDGPRIGEDDKAGLTFMYPKQSGFNDRKNTGGFSCGPDL